MSAQRQIGRTPFGRESELEALALAFDDPETRLVGPVGIGKTSLAAELATRLTAARSGKRSVVAPKVATSSSAKK
jgi:MoxR-like ATPase